MFPTCVVSCTLSGRTVKQRDLWRQRPTYSCGHSAPTRADRQHLVMLVAMSSHSGLCQTRPPSQQDEISVAGLRGQVPVDPPQPARPAGREDSQKDEISAAAEYGSQWTVHTLHHGLVYVGPHPAPWTCIYWAIQGSWFARVNALCNLSRKKSREIAAHFRADF